MLGKLLLLATAFEVGPFYEQRPDADYRAFRPFYAVEGDTTDVLWPIFTAHRDWWRCCFLIHDQNYSDGGHQFEVMPLWFNGSKARRADGETVDYWGLFPIYGYHPHIALMYDLRFCLWPVWTQYRMPRPGEHRWMTSNAVLFPLVSWRDDGSWGVWPLCGFSHNRADDHTYALWPIWNWQTARADRDTAGAGHSWMLWPLLAHVDRERESQWMFLPPFFSYAETPSGWLGRFPLPLVEIERRDARHRTSVFPFYERIVNYRYLNHAETSRLTRFGWRLVEILPDETRVFPFWVSRDDDAYFRLWPFWESETVAPDVRRGHALSLFPIRWIDSVDRNWAKFWTLYEYEANPVETRHSLFWGLISWRTEND